MIQLSVIEKCIENGSKTVWRGEPGDGPGWLLSKWENWLYSTSQEMIRLKIKQPNSMIAVEPAREKARLVGRKQYVNSMRTSSMHLLIFFSCSIYQDFFLTHLHLIGKVLEMLQCKNQEIFCPMAIKCSLANLYIVLIQCCHAWAESKCIIWLVLTVLKRNVRSTFEVIFSHQVLSTNEILCLAATLEKQVTTGPRTEEWS